MANQNLPTTSLTISFSTDAAGDDGAAYALQGEVREEDNGGETRFVFGGAAPVFRIYKSDNISRVEKFPSDGAVSGAAAGSGREEITEVVTFANSRTAGTSYPILPGSMTATPLGNTSLGAISQSGPAEVKCSKQSTGPLDPIVGAVRLTYLSAFTRHQLTGVAMPEGFGVEGFTSYPVLVHLVGVLS